ncbi:MAG: translation elongation factor 4 [Spirochaetales bacterium]|nr:translation elongation factor 4 [Spirochaetales bacterium]
MKQKEKIRNFSIIAHIDHGKSTLADRFIQMSHLISDRDFHDQLLDSMEIERERGITIKSQAITLPYLLNGTEKYILNLVDTPGHVDFYYEVSRALTSCEGAILLIDATQGVQAQTVSNMYMALENNLEIIPVINKIDLPGADIEMVKKEIKDDLGLDPEIVVLVSAKYGTGVKKLLEELIKRIPPPSGSSRAPLQALIFDSHYDAYRGVVVHIRIFEGTVKPGDTIQLMSSKSVYKVEETGTFRLQLYPKDSLSAGEVGYIIAGIKVLTDARVGDTVTNYEKPCNKPLPGFREVKSVVFSSIYPIDADDYELLKTALEKLQLNDASLVYEKDSSAALGFGFRCGFLGLLHLEIIQERLEKEYNLGVVFTAPSVRYRIKMKSGEILFIDNPQEYPDPVLIESTEEPYIKASIITPDTYLGSIINLCLEKRGIQESLNYLDEKRVELVYEMPLAEVIYDFYDRLKSLSKGYASFDYELLDYRPTDLVKLDILLNGKSVDALSQLIFRENAYARARMICKKLRDEIPRHQFKIPIQGAISGQIIARETISALRKDVTAKCYGGDITRKRKLLEKQKAGKKRMKMIGNVQLPQSAFLSVLKTSE